MYVRMHARIYACIYIRMYVFTYIRTYLLTFVYLHMYVCMYLRMCKVPDLALTRTLMMTLKIYFASYSVLSHYESYNSDEEQTLCYGHNDRRLLPYKNSPDAEILDK
jgi:hypothetical protein